MRSAEDVVKAIRTLHGTQEPTAEITSADVDRVDAVDEPATGLPYIMLKSRKAQAMKPQSDPSAVKLAAAIAKAKHDSALMKAIDDRRVAARMPTIAEAKLNGLEQRVATAVAAEMTKAQVRKAKGGDELPQGVVDLLGQLAGIVNSDEITPEVTDLLNQIVAVMNAVDAQGGGGAQEAAASPVDTGEGATDQLAKSAGHDPIEMLKTLHSHDHALRQRRMSR